MQYSEVNDKLPHETLVEICMLTNKTPGEVIKEYMKNEDDFKLWNKVHPECGRLLEVETEDSPYSGYLIKCTWQKKDEKKSARSNFIHDSGELKEKWSELIGKECVFYVSYAKNERDGGVFRVLLDVEPRN